MLSRYRRKSKSIKEAMTYEILPWDRKRLRIIPKKDRGLDFDLYSGIRSYRADLARKVRSGRKVLRLALIKIIERKEMLGVFVALLGVWTSGYLAGQGFAFWSLLALVLAIPVGAFIGGKE